ncbi:MAG: DUF3618 domain-containing protein [Actinomycetota bacterium]|nr:DUF3618 domain-containing protein [Actinomycetota bacterium]
MSEESRRAATRPELEGSDHASDGSGGPARSPDRIEADIEATRERLAGTIDQIGVRVAPKNVARRGVESLKAQFVNPDGSVRAERVAPVAGFVALIVTVRVLRSVGRAVRKGRQRFRR